MRAHNGRGPTKSPNELLQKNILSQVPYENNSDRLKHIIFKFYYLSNTLL